MIETNHKTSSQRLTPLLLAGCLALISVACMAASRAVFPSTPTPLPTATLTPSPTITPSPRPTLPPDTATPTEFPCKDGDCINACMEQLPVIARPGSSPGGGLRPSHRSVEGGKESELITYKVLGNLLTKPQEVPGSPYNLRAFQKDTASQKKVWDYFAALIPQEQRKFLVEYVVFTDGTSNLLAAVRQSDTTIGQWVLMVDIQDATDPQDLTYTLIHEFGHLLTLNPDQVKPSVLVFKDPNDEDIAKQEALSCKTYFPREGCSLPGSYINLFYERFWADIYAEWQKADGQQTEGDYRAAMNAFYRKYSDRFVTTYAVTNPVEDIAESFSFFMLKPKPDNTSVADRKVLFFYEFPELVALREQVARRLCAQVSP